GYRVSLVGACGVVRQTFADGVANFNKIQINVALQTAAILGGSRQPNRTAQFADGDEAKM
ncbi:MAG: hypothetical protein ACRENG_37760, partial [bacterium]